MDEISSKCGNRCDLCPLYIENFSAAQADEINDRLYKYHHGGEGRRPNYTRGCDGCLSDGQLARRGCRIRECTTSRALASCADCDHLFCGLLEADIKVIEGALERYGNSMPSEDYDRYFRPFLIRDALSRLSAAKKHSDSPGNT